MKKKKLLDALRWLGVLPAVVLGAMAMAFLHGGLLGLIFPGLFHDVFDAMDFGGYTILGPFLVFENAVLVVGAGVYAGTHMAPTHRKKVLGILFGLWALVLVFAALGIDGFIIEPSLENPETITRLIVSLFGHLTGFGAVLVLLGREGAS